MKTKPTLIYFLAIWACVLTACNSEDIDSPEHGKRNEVSFNVSNLTRASVKTSLDKFAIFGDTKSLDESVDPPIVLFRGTEVEYINNSWCYEGTQYWIPYYEHSFVAIAPVSVLDASYNPIYSNSQLSFTYAVPTSGSEAEVMIGDMPDILGATYRRKYDPASENNTVVFSFSHLMAKINFSAAVDDNLMTEDEYVKFHKIEFSGVASKANFTITPAAILSSVQTSDFEIDIADHKVESNFTLRFAIPPKVVNNRQSVSLFNDVTQTMLPQSIDASGDAKMKIYYSFNEESELHEAVISLAGFKWEMGKSYNYRFTIERRGIIIDGCQIKPWETIDGGQLSVD